MGIGQRGLLIGCRYQDDFIASGAGNGDHTATGVAFEASPQCSVSHGASTGDYKSNINFQRQG